jgi:hypothetical protein
VTRPPFAAALGLVLALAIPACGKYGPPVRALRPPPPHATAAPAAPKEPAPAPAEPRRDDRRDDEAQP